MKQQSLQPSAPEGTGAAETTMADVGVLANPNDFYKRLRDKPGIEYDPKIGAYLIARYDDLSTVLNDQNSFSLEIAWNSLWSENFRAIMAKEGGGWFPDAIMTDPPNHTRVRPLIERAFTARRIKQLEPLFTAQAQEVIGLIAGKGECDGVNDLAIPVTIRIMAEQLGMQEVDLDTIHRWTTAFTLQIGRMLSDEQMADNARTVCECQHFIIDLVKQRHESPGEDLISGLILARSGDTEQPTLSFDEIVATARAILIGGNETVSTAISNMLFTLATRPDIADQLHASLDDDRLINRFVEELIRIAPPARATSRYVVKDVEIAGQTIPAGSLVMTMFASANDDERQFYDPRTFDLERPNLGRHMGFGAGIHRCVGIALARMEVKVVTRETVRLLKDIRLAVPEEDIPYRLNLANHAMEKLPLSYTAR